MAVPSVAFGGAKQTETKRTFLGLREGGVRLDEKQEISLRE
jgi:hypothetical protein